MTVGEEDETVPIGAIAGAPRETAPPSVVQNGNGSGDPLTGQRDPKLDQHLGAVGKFIGGGSEKAGNIAALVIVLSFIVGGGAGLMLIVVTKPEQVDMCKTIFGSCVTLVSGAMGFLFGRSEK